MIFSQVLCNVLKIVYKFCTNSSFSEHFPVKQSDQRFALRLMEKPNSVNSQDLSNDFYNMP